MEKIYPRLHVLLARESNKAIIIRRGPSKRTCVIGWDRGTDKFYIGQWFKGRIYYHRSDISPDGKYWIYFALHNRYGQTWTVVAKAPYLKAIDFYMKGSAWHGGGIFLKNDTYWLNDRYAEHTRQKKGKELKAKKSDELDQAVDGESVGIYTYKLIRDGWKEINTVTTGKYDCKIYFHKQLDKELILCKIFHATINHPIGKGCYFERHEIIDIKNEKKWEFPVWEWADYDNGHLIWAEYGKIMRGDVR